MGGNARNNLPAEGGCDAEFPVLGVLRSRVRGDGRYDRFGFPGDLGGEEGAGDLEGVERKIVAPPEITKKAEDFLKDGNRESGLRFFPPNWIIRYTRADCPQGNRVEKYR